MAIDLFCTHHDCRCARAAELEVQGRTLDAIEVHARQVTCRRSTQTWRSTQALIDRANHEFELRNRCERSLGWPPFASRGLSLQSLRELVRPVSAKLAEECTQAIRSGTYIVGDRQ